MRVVVASLGCLGERWQGGAHLLQLSGSTCKVAYFQVLTVQIPNSESSTRCTNVVIDDCGSHEGDEGMDGREWWRRGYKYNYGHSNSKWWLWCDVWFVQQRKSEESAILSGAQTQWSWNALPSSNPPRPPSRHPSFSSGGATKLPNEIRLAKFAGRGFTLRRVFVVCGVALTVGVTIW